MTRRRTLVNLILPAAVVGLFALPLALGLGTGGTPPGQAYGGTDSRAETVVEQVDPTYRPWFQPLTEPAPEVESGLFALQAALGAGGLGFALGRLSGRRTRSAGAEPSTEP